MSASGDGGIVGVGGGPPGGPPQPDPHPPILASEPLPRLLSSRPSPPTPPLATCSGTTDVALPFTPGSPSAPGTPARPAIGNGRKSPPRPPGLSWRPPSPPSGSIVT